MSAGADITPPTGFHPYGRLSEIWEYGVFLGLGVTLPFVWMSIPEIVKCGCPTSTGSHTLPWLSYAVVQVANKIPVSFRYPLRGWRAVVDVSTFVTLLAAVVALSLGLRDSLPPLGWQLVSLYGLLGVAHYWLAPRTISESGEPVPMSREIYARSMGTLVNLPMLVAALILALDL